MAYFRPEQPKATVVPMERLAGLAYSQCSDDDAKCEYRDYIGELKQLSLLIDERFRNMDPIQRAAIASTIKECGGILELVELHPEFASGCAGMTPDQMNREFSRFMKTYCTMKGVQPESLMKVTAAGQILITGTMAERPEENVS